MLECSVIMWSLLVGCMLIGAGAQSKPTTCAPSNDCIVRINQGLIRGCKYRSRYGRIINSFRGIRYGKAPVGDLRFAMRYNVGDTAYMVKWEDRGDNRMTFGPSMIILRSQKGMKITIGSIMELSLENFIQSPQPADPWGENIQDTIADGPMCIQKNYLLPSPVVEGKEDCLFLNVYTNKLPSLNANVRNKLPVMVYIHGGGFFSGTGSSSFNGPEYLLDEDVILVTFNYRLGVMGFLSTNDDAAVGNWGLKDQVLALQWVQDNIENFGGDPECVTIFGQSAGAASVHYLILSQTTKGLFNRAISQSGSALNLWATPTFSLEVAKGQGAFMGCTSNKTSELVKCLRNQDAKSLVDSGDKFKFWSVDPLTVYVPSIEKKTQKNPNPFITEQPSKIVKSGNFQKVPFVMGVMENEGIIRAGPISTQAKLRQDLNARWNNLGPDLMALIASVPQNKVQPLWNNITKFYMKNGDFIDAKNSKNIQGFVDMYSDRAFVYGVYQAAKAHAKKAPVYFYKINYAGKNSYAPIFIGSNETVNHTFRVSHCDDLIYLFRTPALFPAATGVDEDFSRVLVKMWTAFARDGTPFGRFWTPLNNGLTDKRFRYMNLAGPVRNLGPRNQIQLQMRNDFFPQRMLFWKNQEVNENS